MKILLSFLAAVLFIAGTAHAERSLHTIQAGEYSAPASPSDVRPVLIGSPVPDVEMATIDEDVINLKQAVGGKPTILIFYRGNWCPYCNRHMAQLRNVIPELRNLGYQIYAISPDKPEVLKQGEADILQAYTLISDHSMKAAWAFGIAFRVDDETVTVYKDYGIDLEAASGESHRLLPVPSVFIIGSDDRIGFTYVNPDYRVRLDPDVLLAAGKAVLKIEPDIN